MSKKDILIVEDGIQERERLKELFLSTGYLVEVCESVTSAQKSLEINSFKLALLDIGLEDRSGSFLFAEIKQRRSVDFVIIFTGNPSIHLKQRFLSEGAVDYIVKGSSNAGNDKLLARVKEIIGEPLLKDSAGIDLKVFLENYLDPNSKPLFFNDEGSFPDCTKCNSNDYAVVFNHMLQSPPQIIGKVVCRQCGDEMDIKIG